MIRKVSKIGPATLMVSLPSKWVRKYGIKKGDEIELMEEGNRIEIWSTKGVHLEEFRTKIRKGTLSHLKSIISNAYKKGYDVIILEYDDESILKDIQKLVDSLLGVEIVSRSKNQCEIKNIAKELESEFENVLKNSFILLMEMSNEVFNDIKDTRVDRKEDMSYKKYTITKYTDFCKRLLNKHRKNKTNMVFGYLIVWNLEKIANEYKYIYDYWVNFSPKNFSKHMFDFFEKVNKLLSLYYQAFYEKDNRKIEQVGKMKDELLFGIYYEIQTKLKKDDCPVMHYLANITRRLWDMCGPFYGYNS